MAEQDDDHDDRDDPIVELSGHVLDPDPSLAGRVRRSINRNMLTGDSLELVVSGLAGTAWNYIRLTLDFFDSLQKDSDAAGNRGPNDCPPTDEEPGS